jgi:hypothetical protein
MMHRAAMSEDELLRTYPIVHPKALNCIPGVFPYNAYREQYFIVSQAGEMNYELLMSLSAETKEEQPAAFNRFIASKEELVSKIEKVNCDLSPALIVNLPLILFAFSGCLDLGKLVEDHG